MSAPSPAMAGARAMAPFVVGLIPFGLAIGAAAARSQVPTALGWSSSIVLYGGSGQLAFLDVAGSGSVLATVAAVATVNVQLACYSVAARAHVADQPRRWRLATAYLLVAPLYSVLADHAPDEPDRARRRAHHLGAGLTLWAAWLVITGVGVVLGAALPPHEVLVAVTPLTLVAMAVAAARERPGLVAAAVAATTAIALHGIAGDLGFLLAAAVGVAAAFAVEARDPTAPVRATSGASSIEPHRALRGRSR